MRISALDIRQQQFSKRMRGIDAQEVAAFLEDVAEDYESVVKENTLLKEQLAVLEERSRNITEHERTLQDTLITTHPGWSVSARCNTAPRCSPTMPTRTSWSATSISRISHPTWLPPG